MVVDTSAILAIAFAEPTAAWVAQQIADADRVLMGPGIRRETSLRFRARAPAQADGFQAEWLATGISFVAPDAAQAIIAARARLTFPLNLGDCFAYALAKAEDLPLLTL